MPDLQIFFRKWTDWVVDWVVFLLKHTFISLCINAMIYADFQKIPFFQVVSFFAYIVSHIGMFEYYFGSPPASSSQLKTFTYGKGESPGSKPSVCKKSPTLNCQLNCVSDQNDTSHLSNESQTHVSSLMEKAFTVKVNHDLIVSLKEIKALLWAMHQRLGAAPKSSKSSRLHTPEEKCKNSNGSDENLKLEMPFFKGKIPKKTKHLSFNGIDSAKWDE